MERRSGLLQDDGHDYSGSTVCWVAEEKAFNARLGGSANERNFVGYLETMKLPQLGRIAEALPAHLRCGRPLQESDPAGAPRGPALPFRLPLGPRHPGIDQGGLGTGGEPAGRATGPLFVSAQPEGQHGGHQQASDHDGAA